MWFYCLAKRQAPIGFSGIWIQLNTVDWCRTAICGQIIEKTFSFETIFEKRFLWCTVINKMQEQSKRMNNNHKIGEQTFIFTDDTIWKIMGAKWYQRCVARSRINAQQILFGRFLA